MVTMVVKNNIEIIETGKAINIKKITINSFFVLKAASLIIQRSTPINEGISRNNVEGEGK